jgi:metallo-beta-lactamase family protein
MRLTFWGAAQTVTGSMHLLELENGKTILMDCGLFQGRRADADAINRHFNFDPAQIDVLLLSHAHIDHAGLIPALCAQGFRGHIFATHATYDLCAIMLMDSAHIQEMDVEYVNKKNKGKQPEVFPLYTQKDTEVALKRFISVGYDTPFSPCEGVSVTYTDAGHILGSAAMVLEITEGGKTKRLGFTGDVGRPDRPIIRDPQKMPDCDWLISESTYGGQTHSPTTESKGKLADAINRTIRKGGKVLIPAFAVGRTQELVYTLDQMWNEGLLPPIPVYVDSPLAVNATGVYQAHPECFDKEIQDFLRDDSTPFGFDKLTYIRNADKSKSLNHQHTPMVIIAASGMCEAGRILHHLRNNVEDPRTTLLMVGYCSENTLGRRLLDGEEQVRIFGEMHNVRAEIVRLDSYSAHADQPELLDFIGMMDKQRLQNIFLVHGEIERQKLLQGTLTEQGYRDIQIPAKGFSVML